MRRFFLRVMFFRRLITPLIRYISRDMLLIRPMIIHPKSSALQLAEKSIYVYKKRVLEKLKAEYRKLEADLE